MGQEELSLDNSSLQAEVAELRSALEALEGDKALLQQTVATLEEEKAALPSDKVAVINSAKVMEEVTFDEEGFVEGQDLTKEEFLQVRSVGRTVFFTGKIAQYFLQVRLIVCVALIHNLCG